MDGGLTNNLPHYREDGVISVSPFPGDFDICPENDMGLGIYNFLSVSNMSVAFNMEHWKLFVQSLIPPGREVLQQLQRQGYQDALRYLKTRGVWGRGGWVCVGGVDGWGGWVCVVGVVDGCVLYQGWGGWVCTVSGDGVDGCVLYQGVGWMVVYGIRGWGGWVCTVWVCNV